MTTKRRAVLGLLAMSTLYSNPYQYARAGPYFTLPDVPEEERIHVSVQKIKKHATKRRGNKLHDKRRSRRSK